MIPQAALAIRGAGLFLGRGRAPTQLLVHVAKSVGRGLAVHASLNAASDAMYSRPIRPFNTQRNLVKTPE